jgi:hypothetical protein
MDAREWYRGVTIERTVKALESNYFAARVFRKRKDLVNAVLDQVKPGMTVGFGGSVTIRELGLIDMLKEKGAETLDHWREGLTKEEIARIRKRQLTCDLFLSGTNAVTEKGELLNIDGVGNRINGMTYGPGKVIVISGYNKIVPDVEAALERVKNMAAPMNAKRLNLPLPCAETGRCHDCKSEARICRIVSIIQRKPNATDFSVYLLNEELGF